MATIASPAPVATEILHLPPAPDGRVRFSRAVYHLMFEVGLLDCRHRFELLDGDIVMMSPIGPDQGAMIRRLMDFFSGRLPASIACSIQLPIVVSDQSEPEPDVVLLNRRDDDYRTGHPGPSDVLLVIEVAQSSLPRDRGEKLQIYAQAAIREYWIVDIEHRGVIVHREPRAGGYRNSKQFHAPAAIAPLAAPDCQLDLAWLFR